MPWKFVPTNLFGRSLGELRGFERSVTLGVSQMATASCRIRQDDPLWPAIAAGQVNLKVYDAQGALRLYGPIVSDEEQADGQGAKVKVAAADLSWELTKRFVGKDVQGIGVSYTQIDTGSIAMNNLTAVNGERATGIVEGVGSGGGGASQTFGKTAIGATTTTSFNQDIGNQGDGTPVGSWFTLPQTASLQKISWYLAGSGASTTPPLKAALYKRDPVSGKPKELVAVSSEVTFNQANQAARWVDFPISGVVTAGDYWIVVYYGGSGVDGGVVGFFDSLTTGVGIRQGGGSEAAPASPWGTGGALNAKQFSTYATYQIVGSSPFVAMNVTYLWRNAFDALNELAAIAGSYEWALRYVDGAPPTVYLDLLQVMGDDRTQSVFLEYGYGRNNCGSYKRARSVDTQATRVWALGEGGTKVSLAYDQQAELIYNARREDVVQFADITIVPLLDALAAGHVAVRKDPRAVVSLSPRKNVLRYGRDYVIGDRVGARVVVANVPRVNGAVRIWGAQIAIDELGNETPTLTLMQAEL